jgi:hypothetical protein
LPEFDPYRILRVSPGASEAEIEESYDRLFDTSEPAALGGDEKAIRRLELLNEAREEVLATLRREQAVQRSRSPRPPRQEPSRGSRSAPPGPARKSQPARGRAVSAASSKGARARNRPSSTIPRLPLAIAGVLLFLLVAASVFLLTRPKQLTPVSTLPAATAGSQQPPAGQTGVPQQEVIKLDTLGGAPVTDSGRVVATVSGQPIIMSDLTVRAQKDLLVAQNDPLMAGLLTQGNITSTRMIDVLTQDSLDKLVNMEVITQQAKKEGLYPNSAQQADLVEQAKLSDLNGVPFDEFLQKNQMTADQYRRNVVRNVVYALTASKHMPATGTEDERTAAFIAWICEVRKGYDVKINLKFQVPNQACTSGLPSDVPLSALPSQGELPPIPEVTGQPQVAPGTPAATPKP